MWFLWAREGEEAGGKSWKVCVDYVCIYYLMSCLLIALNLGREEKNASLLYELEKSTPCFCISLS